MQESTASGLVILLFGLLAMSNLSWRGAHSFALRRCQKPRSWIVSRHRSYSGVPTASITRTNSLHPRLPSRTVKRKLSSGDSTVPAPSKLSKDDIRFLSQALEYARIGVGHTFPNPAVGCVLVEQKTLKVLGAGFHPRSGYPHAELFALLQAAGHIQSGIVAARSIVAQPSAPNKELQALADTYRSDGGPKMLFETVFAGIPVTAYVTLEPCCHYGKTPPCASSLALANVDRVVVGFRDPNPRVDGGGANFLQEAGIHVDMVDASESIHKECAHVVQDFAKRIVPKDYDDENYSHVNGAMRRAIRSLAGRLKRDDSLTQVDWNGNVKACSEDEIEALELEAEWMEMVDCLLWKHELVNLRLSNAVSKKKLAKQLGDRVAKRLGAHVAQSVGHTSLLFRPGIPPVLNLEELVIAGSEDLMKTTE